VFALSILVKKNGGGPVALLVCRACVTNGVLRIFPSTVQSVSAFLGSLDINTA
jgi:hypothetical protein